MDIKYLAKVPDRMLQKGIEQWEQWVLDEPNDTSELMQAAKKKLAEYKAEVSRRKATQPPAAVATSGDDVDGGVKAND